MSENLKSETIHGVFWSFVERYSVQTIQLILNIVMARLLSPESFGLIAMLSIFMSLSQVFIDGGFSSALIQNKDRTEADFCTVFYINISISILIYLILFISAPFIADFYHQPLLKAITRIYSLNLIVNSLVAVNKTKLTIALDFKTQSKISLSSAIISGCVGIVCALMGLGVWALVAQLMSATLINMCLSFFFVKWFPKAIFSKDSFHRLFAFGSKLLIAQIISSIYNNIYNLVIGKKFSSAELGCFSNADKISNFASTNIAGILTQSLIPAAKQDPR
jgi:teichuronic acid exporter